jgi:hypothetical protein
MLDLMAVNQEEGRLPLYLHSINRILRDLRLIQQENNTAFNYRQFKTEVDACDMTPAQLLPLNMRLDTLESFMPKSQTSAKPSAQPKKAARNEFFGNDWSVKVGWEVSMYFGISLIHDSLVVSQSLTYLVHVLRPKEHVLFSTCVSAYSSNRKQQLVESSV